MEDKIEVGEYIRTIDGTIAKIEDDEFDLRYGCFGSIQPFYRYFKNKEQITESIVKHSKNIIDLVDLVGKDMILAWKGEIAFSKSEIKSIVTKEQFESVKYKV